MTNVPANWPPPEPTGAPPKRKSTVIPALIAVGCGFVLVIGSLFGYVATCSMNSISPWNTFFGGVFAVSAIVLIVSIVWLVAAVLVAIFRPRGEKS